MPEVLGTDPGEGISGVGTTIEGVAIGGGPAAGPIGMITRIAVDGQEAGEIDVTTMNSAIMNDMYRSFIASLIDAKGCTVGLLYEKSNMNLVLGLVGGKKQSWVIAFPDGSTLTIPGFGKRLGTVIPFDDKISQDFVIRFSGKPVFQEGSGGGQPD